MRAVHTNSVNILLKKCEVFIFITYVKQNHTIKSAFFLNTITIKNVTLISYNSSINS